MEGLFHAVVESAPDGIVVVDGDGRITLVNGQLEKLFGYTREELLGAPIETLLPERVRLDHRHHRRRYLGQPRSRPMGTDLELAGRRKDGTEFSVDVSLSPVPSNGDVLVMALVRDVTERKDAEARLAYLAALVASSDDAIYSQGLDGSVVSWNRGAERLFGYAAGEVLGASSLLLAPEHRREEARTIFERAREGERLERIETEHRRKDGTLVPVSLTVSPIVDARRRVIGVSAIARDVTEQRTSQSTLAESEARLRESEALAHVGGWAWEAASGEVQWSDELYRIHGVDPLGFEATQDSLLAAVDAADRDRVRVGMAAALDRRHTFEDEYRILRPDGEARWVYARAQPIVDTAGRAIGLRGICQDVTDRHRVEAGLREAYERERAAAEELRAADRLKDEFLSTVSHELRTPLTAIVGFASMLDHHDGEMRQQFVQTIQRNADEMRRMVDRLLDFSRLHAGKVDLHPVRLPLAGAVDDCLTGLATLLHELRVTVDVGDDLVVLADPDGLARILGNLLSNAAKFAPAGSTVEVSACRQEGFVTVCVRDEGPGIPPELQHRVFERFFQTPDQPPGKRGTGVGLAIVERYTELQGGRVWCESEVGAGTRFCFELPAAGMRG